MRTVKWSISASGSSKPHPKDTGEIRPLQYGRGLAALLVCLFHYEGATKYIGENAIIASTNLYFFAAGHSGVEFFFILSGFIIFHAHRSDLDRPEHLGSFYLKRAIRILPMFWFIVIPFGVAVLTISSRDLLTPGKFFLDIFLIPREGTLTLPAAWTLQHEFVFYVLFGLLMVSQRVGAAALVFWQLACVVVLVFTLLPQNYLLPATTFFGYYNFGFIFGIAIAMLRERIDFWLRRRYLYLLGGAGTVGLLTCFVGEWRWGGAFFPSPATSTLIYFVLYSLVILALLALENKPRFVLDATLGQLGAASYVLYIIHEPLYSVIGKLLTLPTLRPFAASSGTFVLSVLLAVATSILLHHRVERPTLRVLRRHLLPTSPRSKVLTTAERLNVPDART